MTDAPERPGSDPAGEVVELCRELIRIDTSNYGDQEGPGERKAAEYVAALLDEVGIESRLYESVPGRTSVVAQWGGRDGDGLLLHGHLDVVPAAAEDWQVDPFSGEIQDGYVWGRGAVDMKDFDAMLLSVVRDRQRTGRVPERPITLCFTADEEAGGHHGAQVLVEQHAEELEGCTEAVGEVGGFSATVRGRRMYLIEAAEKGMAWMKLTARGRAGHGSMINHDNAITTLAAAVARIGAHDWPVRLTPAMRTLLACGRRARRHGGDPGERRGAGRGVRQRRADDGRGHPQHLQPDHARRRLQGERHPDRGDRARRRPLPARLRGRVLRDPRRRSSATTSRSSTSATSSPGRRRTTATWWTR